MVHRNVTWVATAKKMLLQLQGQPLAYAATINTTIAIDILIE